MRQGERCELWTSPFCVFSMGMKRQVEYADLRLASLNNLSRPWGIEATLVVWHLDLRQLEQIYSHGGLECENLTRFCFVWLVFLRGWHVESGLVGFYLKGTPQEEVLY